MAATDDDDWSVDDNELSVGPGHPIIGRKRTREEDVAVEEVSKTMKNLVDNWNQRTPVLWFDRAVMLPRKNVSIRQVDPLLQTKYIKKCENLLELEDQHHNKDEDFYTNYREERGILRLWLYNKKDTWNYKKAKEHWISKFYCGKCQSYPCDPIDDCSPRPEYDERTDPYNERSWVEKTDSRYVFIV